MATGDHILDKRVPSKKEIAANLTQGGIFTFIFAGLKIVLDPKGNNPLLSSVLRGTLFPLVTLITVGRLAFVDIPEYIAEKNKNIAKTATLGGKILSTLAECTAVFFAMMALAGSPLVAMWVVPAMFVGITGFNAVTHFSKACIHFFKMIRAANKYGKDSVDYAHHKALVKANLIPAISFGITAAVIGLLMLAPLINPGFFAIAPVLLPTVIQAAGAVATGMLSVLLPIGQLLWKRHKSKQVAPEPIVILKQPGLTPAASDVAALSSNFEAKVVAASGLVPKLAPGSVPAPIGVPSDEVKEQYKNLAKFTSLHTRLEDMARTLEVSKESDYKDEPQQIMLDFLKQEQQELAKSASSSNNGLDFKGKKLQQDKYHAVGLLIQLVKETALEQKTGIEIQVVKNGPTNHKATTVAEIEAHLKLIGMETNVHSSKGKSVGYMQKLLDLSTRYMSDPDLHPVNRGGDDMPLDVQPSAVRYRATAAPAA